MKKLVAFALMMTSTMVFGQQNPRQPIPTVSDQTTPYIEPLKLDGPRMGVIYSPLANYDLIYANSSFYSVDNPVPDFLSTIGWQFEWKYFSTMDGSAGLLEVMPMITGMDAGLFIPSLNMITGYRSKGGFEFGLGPNINPVGAGMIFAVGQNFNTEHVNFPVHLAVIKGRESMRMVLTFGFNLRSKSRSRF
ncbi:MAG: hypothetical protein JJU02_07535 [Cryomorphaceae bacterium]|nr:hypothetical protein [Cryomorphaceae bacterium]